MMVHIHGFNAYLHLFYYIYPFLLQTANPLPMLAGAAMMNVGVDKVRLGVHVCILFFIKFVCEARLSLKRGKQTIELITTTNPCSIIKNVPPDG